MYLSRLILNPRSRAVRKDLADCHALHRTVMNAFPQTAHLAGEGARARFGVLHRLDTDPRGNLVLYVQSIAQPDWSSLPPGYLAPMPAGVENPASKSVAEPYGRIRAGSVLRFRLRGNPTRKVDTKSGPNGEKRNGRRVGLVQEEEQIEWLRGKALSGGFALLDLVVHGAGTGAQVVGARGAGTLAFRAVTFVGRLLVTDPELFRTTVVHGIGSGKAYGFGLLSVAPADG